MFVRLSALRMAVDPNMFDIIVALSVNSARAAVDALDITAITDNSTGVGGSAIVAVNTQDAKVAQSGANLGSRTAFNTAIGKVNNALSVLASYLSGNGWEAIGQTALAGYDGAIAVAGTVPALDKVVAGVDGSAGNSMLRVEFNSAISRARNNLATLVRVYNSLAVSLGVATLVDGSGGAASGTNAFLGNLTAPTAVGAGAVATSDLATKAAADAALTALANNIATLSDKIDAVLLHATTTGTKKAIIVVP